MLFLSIEGIQEFVAPGLSFRDLLFNKSSTGYYSIHSLSLCVH